MQSRFPREMIESRAPGMWRYREAIPIPFDVEPVSFGEGFTPLLPIDFDGRRVLVKQEQLFPSGSYKDRGASVLVTHIKRLGISHVVEDSSGNAGAAVAAYCAAAGISCDIYVPGSTSEGKLVQVLASGAGLHKIPGNREDTAKAVLEAAQHHYYASHVWSSFFFHGTKTFAFEVCEQLGWTAPDAVILPVGNGTLMLGAAIGFRELQSAGIIQTLPRLIGVQAANCAPLAAAIQENQENGGMRKVDIMPTAAEGIAIGEPLRGLSIIEAIRDTGGEIITVTETEILNSLRIMCRRGFYIEPTSAAAVAGVFKLAKDKTLDNNTVVSVFTGHGLKAGTKIANLLNS